MKLRHYKELVSLGYKNIITYTCVERDANKISECHLSCLIW
jgi:hypothetical protein